MTIAELESSLNLSFHDALLHSLSTDFVARRAELILDVCVGDPEAASSAERERRRRGRLELTGLQYLAIDPPDPKYPYAEPEPVDVDPCDADASLSSRYPMPKDTFAGRLFVSDWNGFIHYAAADASLAWLEN